MSIISLLDEISHKRFATESYGDGIVNLIKEYLIAERRVSEILGFFCIIEPEEL